MRRWVLASLLVAGIIFACACSGGGSSSTTQQLRIVMASPDAPRVDILIDGTQVATALGYMNLMPYIPLRLGARRVEAVTVSNSKPVFQQNVSVQSGANQTLFLTGPVSAIESLQLTDGNTTSTVVATGDGEVRVVNASTTASAADVYILTAGSSIVGAKAVASKLPLNQATGYQPEAIGDYEVLLTAPGTTSVLLNTGSLALTQGQFQTVVALDDPNGGLTYLVLTDQ